MRPDTITLAIEEKYSPEEKAEIAAQLAMAISDLETIRDEKKVSDAAFNERIKAKDAAINDLAKRYNKGCETAQIGCDIKYDNPEPGKKSYYRMDRGELVNTYEMSWEEKQETIQFPLSTSTEAPAETPEVSTEDASKFEADELAKLVGDTTVCQHPTVSNADGTWKCDTCGEVLDALKLATEERPFEIGQIPPPEDFDQSGPVAT